MGLTQTSSLWSSAVSSSLWFSPCPLLSELCSHRYPLARAPSLSCPGYSSPWLPPKACPLVRASPCSCSAPFSLFAARFSLLLDSLFFPSWGSRRRPLPLPKVLGLLLGLLFLLEGQLVPLFLPKDGDARTETTEITKIEYKHSLDFFLKLFI